MPRPLKRPSAESARRSSAPSRARPTASFPRVEAYKTGLAAVYLGAGRNKTDDPVFPDVGILFEKKRGDKVKRGETLLRYYAEKETDAEAAEKLLAQAMHVAERPETAKPMILKEIAAL